MKINKQDVIISLIGGLFFGFLAFSIITSNIKNSGIFHIFLPLIVVFCIAGFVAVYYTILKYRYKQKTQDTYTSYKEMMPPKQLESKNPLDKIEKANKWVEWHFGMTDYWIRLVFGGLIGLLVLSVVLGVLLAPLFYPEGSPERMFAPMSLGGIIFVILLVICIIFYFYFDKKRKKS